MPPCDRVQCVRFQGLYIDPASNADEGLTAVGIGARINAVTRHPCVAQRIWNFFSTKVIQFDGLNCVYFV